MATQGIPGMAIGMATLGGFLMFVGIKDVPIRDGLRELLAGKVPEGTAKPKKTAAAAQAVLARGAMGGMGIPGGGGGGIAQAGSGAVSGGAHPEIARTALQFLGVPYKWGGTTPSGFDCSGLVQYVLKKHGYNIGRTTYQQQPSRLLTTIPRSSVGAGDLIFWPGHVAIAISNSEVVHASRRGTPVKTSPIESAGPVGTSPTFKRIKGSSSSAAPRSMAV